MEGDVPGKPPFDDEACWIPAGFAGDPSGAGNVDDALSWLNDGRGRLVPLPLLGGVNLTSLTAKTGSVVVLWDV